MLIRDATPVLRRTLEAAKLLALPPTDIWAMDFPSLEQWAAVVEGTA